MNFNVTLTAREAAAIRAALRPHTDPIAGVRGPTLADSEAADLIARLDAGESAARTPPVADWISTGAIGGSDVTTWPDILRAAVKVLEGSHVDESIGPVLFRAAGRLFTVASFVEIGEAHPEAAREMIEGAIEEAGDAGDEARVEVLRGYLAELDAGGDQAGR